MPSRQSSAMGVTLVDHDDGEVPLKAKPWAEQVMSSPELDEDQRQSSLDAGKHRTVVPSHKEAIETLVLPSFTEEREQDAESSVVQSGHNSRRTSIAPSVGAGSRRGSEGASRRDSQALDKTMKIASTDLLIPPSPTPPPAQEEEAETSSEPKKKRKKKKKATDSLAIKASSKSISTDKQKRSEIRRTNRIAEDKPIAKKKGKKPANVTSVATKKPKKVIRGFSTSPKADRKVPPKGNKSVGSPTAYVSKKSQSTGARKSRASSKEVVQRNRSRSHSPQKPVRKKPAKRSVSQKRLHPRPALPSEPEVHPLGVPE